MQQKKDTQQNSQECALTGGVYRTTCPHCMLRKIKMLRSPNGALSKKLQLGAFSMMPPDVAQEVKQMLAQERTA